MNVKVINKITRFAEKVYMIIALFLGKIAFKKNFKCFILFE